MSSSEFGPPAQFDLDFYSTASGKEPAADFIQKLPADKRATLVSAIERILQQQGIDVCESKWGKNLGSGLCEFRVRDKGIVLRLYFHPYGKRMLLLLAGFDKGRFGQDRREQKAIKTATAYLEDWKRSNQSSQ